MDDSSSMAVVDAVAQLVEEELDLILTHSMFVLAQVLFHIVVDKFKDQV